MLNAGGGGGEGGEGVVMCILQQRRSLHACARTLVACQTIGIHKVHYRHARTPLLMSNTDVRHFLTHAHKRTHSEILEVVTVGRDLHWMPGDPSLWLVLHNFQNARQGCILCIEFRELHGTVLC